MSERKLEPCIYCGSPAEYASFPPANGGRSFYIACADDRNCDANGCYHLDPEAAAAHWNRMAELVAKGRAAEMAQGAREADDQTRARQVQRLTEERDAAFRVLEERNAECRELRDEMVKLREHYGQRELNIQALARELFIRADLESWKTHMQKLSDGVFEEAEEFYAALDRRIEERWAAKEEQA